MKKVIPGAVNTGVIIELADGLEVVLIITKESAKRLGLVEGKAVYALIKASDVMVAADET